MRKILRYIKHEILPFIQAVPTHMKGNECQKFQDNVLLHKMLAKAPRYYDRALEYPWALRNVNLKRGNFLDVGSTVGKMFRENLPTSVKVYTINSEMEQRFEKNDGIERIVGDIRDTDFKDGTFDVITCISTLEHIGVGGRYHIKNEKDGDIKAMTEMRRILKKGGRLLLSVPYGKNDVLPLNKLYNKKRTKELFKGYKIISENYMKYNPKFYIWMDVSEQTAADTNWRTERWYALAFYVLEKI